MSDEFVLRRTAIPILTGLDSTEDSWWASEIKRYRSEFIKPPADYIGTAFAEMSLTATELNEDIDAAVRKARSISYRHYLEDEAIFHTEVFKQLTRQRELPRAIMSAIVKPLVGDLEFPLLNEQEMALRISDLAGEFVGKIFPYVYQLCLSTTQSRRSRAGKEFELVIEQIMGIYGYAYESQSNVGTARFEELDLAKAVDFLVPSADAYLSNRPKCAVITAKTTLRERWQQVAEELQRTNVPAIYLLTLDEGVSESIVKKLTKYNITLVVPGGQKESKFSHIDQVLSFESFFAHDLPHVLAYWKTGEN